MPQVIMYAFLKLKGDDDPIDIVDLSQKDRKLLDIIKVKVLGAFCLIDEGELDWKVLVMDVD
jgi:inorganic pyrophosphatase